MREIISAALSGFFSYIFLQLGALAPLSPYPLLICFERKNIYLKLLCVAIFLGLGLHNFNPFNFSLEVYILFIALLMFFLINKPYGIFRISLAYMGIQIGLFAGLVAYTYFKLHITPDMLITSLESELINFYDSLQKVNAAQAANYLPLKTNARELAKEFIYLLPAYFVLAHELILWINLVLIARVERTFNKSFAFARGHSLRQFENPNFLLPFLLISLASFTYYFGTKASGFYISTNALLILASPYFFQGISIVLYYSYKMKFRSLMRSIIICFFFYPMLPLTLLIGLIDNFVDIRKMRRSDHASHT